MSCFACVYIFSVLVEGALLRWGLRMCILCVIKATIVDFLQIWIRHVTNKKYEIIILFLKKSLDPVMNLLRILGRNPGGNPRQNA